VRDKTRVIVKQETKQKRNGTERNETKQKRNETRHKRKRNDYYLDKLQVLIAKNSTQGKYQYIKNEPVSKPVSVSFLFRFLFYNNSQDNG
jgi:hypothetical protein